MQLIDLVNYISTWLVEKKLISSAQNLMIPPIRTQKNGNLAISDHPKLSSVLILLLERRGKIFFVVTQRQEYDGVHSGQISLPGGQFEQNDLNLEKTAIRETQEEIGISIDKISVLGKLSDLYIPPSNFKVTPYVGVIFENPMYKKDELEVAKIIEVPIDELLDESNVKIKSFYGTSGLKIEAPYFHVQDIEIWGATAMILSEFKEILKSILSAK